MESPEATLKLYGDDVHQPGTFAANCLLARRLAERGVRFIHLFHQGWDFHANLPGRIHPMCKATDQASAGLVKDLKSRGMLEDTLVIWGSEFGRTNYCQGKMTKDDFGRDHHPRCFTIWLAGGGSKAGYTHGKTDDFSYNIDEDPVHIHDFHATLLHLAWDRPQTPDLPLPRQGLSPYRCPWKSRETSTCLIHMPQIAP